MASERVVSKLVRRTHLFVALFLSPWITMYGLSTLVMHHRQLLTGHEERVPPDFDVIRESLYDLPLDADATPEEVAEHILMDLGISGGHTVRRGANSPELTIHRDRPIGSYRLTYDPIRRHLKVERQQFGLAFFLEMLHRRRGFDESYRTNDLWALIVDLVILAIVLWVVTGLWMWLGMPRTRKPGSLCLIGGSALFALLLFTL